MRFKKLLAALTCASVICGAVPSLAEAASSRQFGINASKTLYDDGTLIVSGTGAIRDYTYTPDRNHWEGINWGNIRKVINIVIEDGITRIGNYAFYYCYNAESITIPESVTSIGDGAFRECESLTAVNIPENVTSIGNYAFYGCTALQSIYIPSNVTNIGEGAFANCGNLMIYVDENNPCYSSVDGILFNKEQTEIIAYAKDKIAPVYNIPYGITDIGNAFSNCYGLTSLILPESVAGIGEEAFTNCGNLMIFVNENNPYYSSIDGVLFNKDKTELIACALPTAEYTVPDGVTTIRVYAFKGCDSLTSLIISEGVTTIGKYALYNCNNLTMVFIPKSLTSIAESTFSIMSDIKNIYYAGTEEDWNSINIGKYNYALRDADITYEAEYPEPTPTPIPTPTASGVYNGHTYAVYDEPLTWHDARYYCAALGGHLVTITDEGEQEFIAELAADGGKSDYWLGANAESGEYVWVTGEAFDYANWDSGEPNKMTRGDGAAELYAEIYTGGDESRRFKWNDTFYDNEDGGSYVLENMGFICELEGVKSSFNSLVSDWAVSETEKACAAELIPETLVGEDLTARVTRGEFAAIAVKLYEALSGEQAASVSTPFDDIAGDKNAEDIAKAYGLNIIVGASGTEFEPDAELNREQLATMLCRTIKKYKFADWTYATDSEYPLDTEGAPTFADDAEISDYAKQSVYYMAKMGIINGIDDTRFAPQNITEEQAAAGYATATREQAIALSLRIYKLTDL